MGIKIECRLMSLFLATVWMARMLVADGQTYQVTVHSNPDTSNIPMLTNVTLSCRIHPLPSTYHYFEWTSNNGYYSSRYTNQSTISIPWFRPGNSGTYWCTVYLGNGSPLQSDSRHLTAQGSGLAISYPYFHKIESGAMLMVKGRVSVFCYCSSCPQSFGWRYGNLTGVPESPLPFELKAKNNHNEYILSTNQYSFSLLNKGLYICDLGTSQNKLEVTLNPRSDFPTILDAQRGRELYRPDLSVNWTITCTTDNDYSPDPSITWLHNGNSIGKTLPWRSKPIPARLNDYVSFGESLTIQFGSNEDVSGEYTCSVHNGKGTVSAKFLLEPTGPLVITKVSRERENLRVGDVLTLNVTASGSYRDIGWLLNGQLFGVWIHTAESFFFQCPDHKCWFENYGKRLVINGVTVAHHGIYDVKLFKNYLNCNESDSKGCDGELVTFTRDVYGPPSVFIVHDTDSTTDLRLICHVSGQPIPTVTWKLNGTTILSDSRHTITQSGDNSILVVQNPQWGRYSCEGSNVNPYEPGSSPLSSSDSYSHGGAGQVAPLEVVAERISESTLALVAVVVVMIIIMAVLVGVIFFVRCSYRKKAIDCRQHCFKKKKNQANSESPYENTTINERDRENDYITMKPARVSTSAVDMPLPSTPSVAFTHVTSPVMSSVVSVANGAPAVRLEVASV